MRAMVLAGAVALVAGTAVAAPPAVREPRVSGTPAIRVDDDNRGKAAADTDFLFQLGLLEGHLIVGHDLLAAKRSDLALPHFGHPVREIYDDISDYLGAHKIAPFDAQLVKLEAAVTAAPGSPETEAQYQAVIATVHKARDSVPASIRDSVPAMIKVCADTVDAASGEFGESLNHGRIETLVEYHDSRGFLSYVAQTVGELASAHKDAADQSLLEKFKSVLAKAQYIVEPLLPAPTPRASVAQYRDIAAEAEKVAQP